MPQDFLPQGETDQLLAAVDVLAAVKKPEEAPSQPEKKETPKKPASAKDMFEATKKITAGIHADVTGETPDDDDATPPTKSQADFFDVTKLQEDQTPDPQPTPPTEQTAEAEAPVSHTDTSKENNLGALRKLVKKAEEERNEARREARELQEKQKLAPDSQALSEKISSLEARIKELEPLEYRYNLSKNPKFQESFIAPEEQAKEELEQLAGDYGLDLQDLLEVAALGSKKEINSSLQELFQDQDARNEARGLISKLQTIRSKRSAFEKEAKSSLMQLEAEEKQQKAVKDVERTKIYEESVTKGWTKAISDAQKLSDDKKLWQLTEIPGNKAHNEQVVRPVVQAAQKTYQDAMKYIEQMIRVQAPIPEEFSSYMAMLAQQAATTQMLNYTNNTMYQELKRYRDAVAKQNGVNRPGYSPTSKAVKSSQSKATTPKDRLKEITEAIGKEVLFGEDA